MALQTENVPVATETTYCAKHPTVETALRCGRCDTLICPKCMVASPVGSRCRDCAQIRRLPTYNVPRQFFVRAYAAGIVGGAVLGYLWSVLFSVRSGGIGFLSILIGAGIGFGIAWAIDQATNAKRGPALQGAAVLGVVLAYFVRNLANEGTLIVQDDIGAMVAVAVGVFVAINRLR
jgi:hypothetical protein